MHPWISCFFFLLPLLFFLPILYFLRLYYVIPGGSSGGYTQYFSHAYFKKVLVAILGRIKFAAYPYCFDCSIIFILYFDVYFFPR